MRIWKSFRISHIIALTFVYLLILVAPQKVQARWSFVPRFYVEEQYDDNLFLTKTDEQDDFATILSPGVDLKYESPTALVDLDYEFRRFFYYEFSELDYSEHRGRLEARKDFTPRFSAGVNETFIRSEDPVELTGLEQFERPSIRAGERNRYTRNIVEPDMTFRFGERSSIRFRYRNNILRNDAEDVADQDENRVNALLSHHFNIHNGIELFYEHIDQDFGSTTPPTVPRDFKGDVTRGRYSYYFDPRTSVFAEYRYIRKDLNRESSEFFDYEVHNPRLGFSHSLLENLSLAASAGYILRKADEEQDKDAFSGRLNFSGKYKRLGADVYTETGFDDDFTSAESLGFFKFWRAGTNARYQLLERLRAEAFFFVTREKFVDIGRTDKFYNFRGRLNYQVWRWTYLSFDYVYNKRDSNVADQSYESNRFFLGITFQYDIAEQFQ